VVAAAGLVAGSEAGSEAGLEAEEAASAGHIDRATGTRIGTMMGTGTSSTCPQGSHNRPQSRHNRRLR
jgi:hypothetical protein